MKNNSTKLHILLFGLALSTAACNSNQADKARETADTLASKAGAVAEKAKEGAENVAGKIEDALKGNPDSVFVVKAALDNSKELRLLQAGVDFGTDKELKAHAKMMLADHKKLGGEVKEYSSKKGYILPDGDNGKADDELNTLNKKNKGKEWDKEWTDALTTGHKDAIDLFENYQSKVKDEELKSMITNTLPTLHKHLDMMQNLQNKMGK